VPPVYALDLADAEARFRELSRRFHPDRFAKADPRARRASLQRSVQLNEAWRTLRDPVRRADYTYDFILEDVPASDLNGATEDNVKELTRRHVSLLERYIRMHPDHWLWMHRRWKHLAPTPGPEGGDSVDS